MQQGSDEIRRNWAHEALAQSHVKRKYGGRCDIVMIAQFYVLVTLPFRGPHRLTAQRGRRSPAKTLLLGVPQQIVGHARATVHQNFSSALLQW